MQSGIIIISARRNGGVLYPVEMPGWFRLEAGVVSSGGQGAFVRVHWVHVVSCIGWTRSRALGAHVHVHWVHTLASIGCT